jgi:hypothetical protein
MQVSADALLLALAGAYDIAFQLPEPAHIRKPRLHAVAAALDRSAANGHKAEEAKAHSGLPDLDPAREVRMPGLPIRPPPDNRADEHDQHRAIQIQEPYREENGTRVEKEKTDLVPGDVIEKADHEHANQGQGHERTL